MSWWEALLDSLGIIGVLAALALVFLFARRRLLSRSGGTFECSVRMTRGEPGHTRGWTLGLGRYDADTLEWFRIFSFSTRPKHVFDRSISIGARRAPSGAEAYALYTGHVVVPVELADRRKVEMAMSAGALTGLLAWLESAPPGRQRRLG